MTDARILLYPTAEHSPAQREKVPRPASLAGLTVGLLDISKPHGDIFLNRLEHRLGERGLTVKRYQKPTYTCVAPTALQQQIATECSLVIEALAD